MPDELRRAGLDDGAAQDPMLAPGDIAELSRRFGLPVVVKGILRADDAIRAIEAGAAGIVVSNHGGRQLDGAIATARALPEIAEAIGERAEVYVDGGIRNGVDVLRALALGARAAFIGRPAVWGLALGGQAGVTDVLERITEELRQAMVLAGVGRLAEVTPDLLGESLRGGQPQ
jgi:4-hydroxymandelate oxidase